MASLTYPYEFHCHRHTHARAMLCNSTSVSRHILSFPSISIFPINLSCNPSALLQSILFYRVIIHLTVNLYFVEQEKQERGKLKDYSRIVDIRSFKTILKIAPMTNSYLFDVPDTATWRSMYIIIAHKNRTKCIQRDTVPIASTVKLHKQENHVSMCAIVLFVWEERTVRSGT